MFFKRALKLASRGNSAREFEFLNLCATGKITNNDIDNYLYINVDIDAFIVKCPYYLANPHCPVTCHQKK